MTAQERAKKLLSKAKHLRELAQAEYEKADLSEEKSGIPLGQPILVGHHSEKAHRRAIERANRHMRKAVELTKEADELEARARNVRVATDDDDALIKAKAKLAELEALREKIKHENAAARRRGETPPHERFTLNNLAARIRNARKRVEQLEAIAERKSKPNMTKTYGGVDVVWAYADNRLRIYFPEKVRDMTILKRNGWRWSPKCGCWQRQLTNAAIYSASMVLKHLGYIGDDGNGN